MSDERDREKQRSTRKYVVTVLLPELGITLPGAEDPGKRARQRREWEEQHARPKAKNAEI
jgi:hypothetical protein